MPKPKEKTVTVPLYTPVLRATGERLRIVNAELAPGFKPARSRAVKGVLRDPATGKRYKITGKACGLKCFCDAYADEITEAN